MKWAVIGLCLLGAVAAASAALLVNSLRIQTVSAPVIVAAGTPDVAVLFAKKSLPPMTVIQSSAVELRNVPASKAPPQGISSPVAVVGKVLTKPIAEGEAFTASHFADPASAQQLAAVIPNGKRAVGISVTNFAGLDGLLYPGSMVDVLVSLKQGEGAGGNRRDAFSATLLTNIQVLAIEQQTVVSPTKMANPVDVGRANDSHCVTLLVDSHQAKVLQLAMEQGTLSLALRNPLDPATSDPDTYWAQSLMGEGLRHPPTPAAPVVVEKPAPATEPAKPHWDMVIMRGGTVETKSFPMPANVTAED